ncbi:MAG: polyprenyl synthetase family protein [Ancrocorticia sp.]|uniref:polyprenyl synthetase family protein n=1 Tax=Ancrocorticia sp. TaxID=2593684 RepID=UPI003F93B093
MHITLPEFRHQVTNRLSERVDALAWLISTPSEDGPHTELLAPARSLITGGKRTRAAFVLAGYQLATEDSPEAAIIAGSALELYQNSALVHDDVIDDSPTRRGKPAAHILFGDLHNSHAWLGSGDDFARAGAILLGDLLLAEAGREFHEAACLVAPAAASRATTQFHDMCVEVAFGQYLDIRAEHQPLANQVNAIESALSVLRHKSASYSVQLPLTIGAMLGGGSPQLTSQLRTLGGLLGEAFQMRDDDLGIFGEPDQTGKPSCGDITEGKRTVLLALMREASGNRREWIDSLMGTDLTDSQIDELRSFAVTCGARSRHEQMINEREAASRELLATLDGRAEGAATLAALMDELQGRNS